MGMLALGALAVAGISAISQVSQKSALQSQVDSINKTRTANAVATVQAENERNRLTGLQLTEEKRRALREASSMIAKQASTGVGGITSERVLNNSLFQSTLNEGTIQAKGEADLANISMQGNRQEVALTGQVNQAYAQMPSTLGIIANSAIAGAQTYLMGSLAGAGTSASTGATAVSGTSSVPSASFVNSSTLTTQSTPTGAFVNY